MLAVLILHIFTVMVSAQSADAVLGIWHSPHGNLDIQIIKKGSNYFGHVVILEGSNNEHGQTLSDTGTEILKNFRYRNGGVYTGGKVLDSKSGKSYNGQMKLIGNDKLDIRIFFGIIQLGRTEIWTRILQHHSRVDKASE